MPQVVSKPKNLPRMSDRKQKRVGRVTGSTSDIDPALPTATGQSVRESSSSGYLSASSLETSDQEKRLKKNEQKVFQLWERLGQRKDQPMNSTSKNADCTNKSRLNLSTKVGKSTMSTRKNLGAKPIEEESENDSFWGIATPKLLKSRSDIDMRGENRIRSVDLKSDLFSKDSVQQLPTHDAGSAPNLSTRRVNAPTTSDWKRRQFSTSNPELRLSENSAGSSSRESGSSGYQFLLRYRVVVGESKPTTTSSSTELVNKISNSCSDFTDSSVSVDESMSEFLANVDQDNLASFLNFYDKVTSSAACEKVLEKFVDAVVENLERRFPNTAEIDALRVFDPQMWPEDQTECDEFGNQDIEMLADRFRTSLPTPEDIIMEYKLVKNTVKSNQDLNQQSMSRIMEEVAGPLATSCPNLAKIAAVGLLIPASTADCERGFSALKRIKNDQRNRLKNDNLQSLLMISVEGPPTLEFSYEEAVTKTFGYLGDKNGVLCLGFAHIVDHPTAEYSIIRLNAHGPEKHLLSPQIVEPPNRKPPFPSINETCGVQAADSYPLAYIRRWERRCAFPDEMQKTWNYTFHIAKSVTFSKKTFAYNLFNGEVIKFDCIIKDDSIYVLKSSGYFPQMSDGVMCFNITKLAGDLHYQYELSRLNSGTELENQVKLVPAGSMLSLEEEYCDYLESPARPEYIY